jgi:Transglycosylase SLT domain
MRAGYTGLPQEHREAYEAQMRTHERAYPRVREHALTGADRDFDTPLHPGEREHQRHLRQQEGLQEHDVHRIRQELRGASEKRHVAPRSPRRNTAATAGPRAARAAAGASASIIPGTSGNTGMYLFGIALLLCLLYLLVAGKGTKAITGLVNTVVGGISAFVRPVDPISQLETALGAHTPQSASGSSSGVPGDNDQVSIAAAKGGTPAEKAQVKSISKQLGWNESAWEDVIEKESGWNPDAVNAETDAYGIGQFNPKSGTLQDYAKYGSESKDPLMQLDAMAVYIQKRYGDPTAALAHEQQFGWY